MSRQLDAAYDPLQPALIVTYGNTAQKYRPLTGDLVVLGRGRSCDIGLMSSEIAEAHCLLVRNSSGWRIRDCGSRFGTRLNGKAIQEAPLSDGDVLQVGTFAFQVHLPPRSALASAETGEGHRRQERRRWVERALRLRRRLHEERSRRGEAAGVGSSRPAEVDRQLDLLRSRLRQYEQRAVEVAEQERDLARDRETLDREYAALQARIEQTEQALARRQQEVEVELRRRWQEFEQRCRETERTPPGTAQGEEARRLDQRRQELDAYARHLRRQQAEGKQQSSGEVVELRKENERLRQLLERAAEQQQRAAAAFQEQLEAVRGQLAASEREKQEKEVQIQYLLTQQRPADPSPVGMDLDSYEAELAAFRRQLEEDRRGLNEEMRLLRTRTLELNAATRSMERELAQERARLSWERQSLNEVREVISAELQKMQRQAGLRDWVALLTRIKEGLTASQQAAAEARGPNGRGSHIRAALRLDSGTKSDCAAEQECN